MITKIIYEYWKHKVLYTYFIVYDLTFLFRKSERTEDFLFFGSFLFDSRRQIERGLVILTVFWRGKPKPKDFMILLFMEFVYLM